MKTALITGVTGQDGSYLVELLLAKGYEVHGLVRRSSVLSRERLEKIQAAGAPGRLKLHYGDLSEPLGLVRVLQSVQPDEVYNLAAQSHVGVSFELPDFTGDVTGVGVLRLLEAIRLTGLDTRFYQASSSELFGSTPPPQNETTPFHPRSPYAVAKLYGYWATVNYREAYGMFACNGILFNHESPRRGENFVTRKVTRAAAAIKLGKQKELVLGNLEARRDWGFAGDYVEAMWLMLQHHEPIDFVISTGESHTIRELCEVAFNHVGLNYQDHVVSSEKFIRPSEVDHLLGDCSLAKALLGWEPKVSFNQLITMMVDSDLAALG